MGRPHRRRPPWLGPVAPVGFAPPLVAPALPHRALLDRLPSSEPHLPELPPPPPPPMSVAAAVVDVVKSRLPAWVTPRAAIVVIGAFAAALAVLATLGWGPAPAAAPVIELPKVGSAGDPSAAAGSAGSGADRADLASGDGAAAGVVAVHAAGAFAHPGLYRLAAGARVADLVDAAGGPAPGAVVDALNLAAKLTDGERVYLPKEGEAAPVAGGDPAGATGGTAGAAGGSAGLVDLNTATLDALDGLPGVGPSTAQAILDYRQEHGRFRSVDELLEVRGIGEAKLAAIRKRVRV